MMPGRRWSEGLHQAIEAKEGVRVRRENVTLATITFQNYFRMYEKLAGMTGTAETEAEEFHRIYNLEVVVDPDEQADDPRGLPPISSSRTRTAKFGAVIEEIEEMREERPAGAGRHDLDREVGASRAELLERKGIAHEVLNAKQHEREAAIIADAGQPGAVTIATNMAGRGTDIMLGAGVAGRGRPAHHRHRAARSAPDRQPACAAAPAARATRAPPASTSRSKTS